MVKRKVRANFDTFGVSVITNVLGTEILSSGLQAANIFNYLVAWAENLGLHFIGLWDEDFTDSQVAGICRNIFVKNLGAYKNYLTTLYKSFVTSYPISIEDKEAEEKTYKNNDYLMMENSPINSDIETINTPSAKTALTKDDTVVTNYSRENAHESMERIKALNELQGNFDEVIYKVFYSIIDEYNTAY